MCPKCGLPKELCVCATIEKEAVEKIKVHVTKMKYDKFVTIVEGIDKSAVGSVAKELKRSMACGGTVKGGRIILQGDHRAHVKAALTKLGYAEENISVV